MADDEDGHDDESEGEDESESEGGAASSDSGDPADTGNGMITVSGLVTGFAEQSPIAGAQVCFQGGDAMPCVTTDANGRYELTDVPPGIEGAIVVSADGYMPGATWGVTSDGFMAIDQGLLSAAAVEAFAAAVGTPFDDTKAHIAVGVSDGMNPVAGATLSITPASGVQAYVGDDGLPNPMLDATQTSGVGGWIDVEPGEVELAVTHPSATCAPSASAIPGSAANTTRLPLLAGHFNNVVGGVTCM